MPKEGSNAWYRAYADRFYLDKANRDTYIYRVSAGVVGVSGMTLTSPTIQGTVLAGTGLTMPAFTAGGDITLGANKLKTTNLTLKQLDVNTLAVMNLAEDAYLNFSLAQLNFYSALAAYANGLSIVAHGGDTSYLAFQATDAGVASIEVARLQGAADPYFQATLPLRLLPIATASLPATPVEGMLAYDDTDNKLKVYNGSAWETVTSG